MQAAATSNLGSRVGSESELELGGRGWRDVQGELRARERGLNLTLLGLQPHPAPEFHPPLVALGPIAPTPGFPTSSLMVGKHIVPRCK